MFAHNFAGAVQSINGGGLATFGGNEIIGILGTGFTTQIAKQ
jgi:hypothetical protein